MNIFLTGATGFLGGRLVRALANNSNHTLYLLARSKDKGEALKASLSIEAQERTHIIIGDIILPHLGIASTTLDQLHQKIDVVYHLAALVKFDDKLRDELFQINLEGTKNTLAFAKHIQASKFLYVSTAYTVGKRNVATEHLYDGTQGFNNFYEETKHLAETAVFDAQKELDVSIFRPSIIVGDSLTGEADSSFTLYGFMRALEVFKRRLNKNPKNASLPIRLFGSEEGTSNFVPVDYVADILLAALYHAEEQKVYHITNASPPTNIQILESIKQALQFQQLSIVEPNTQGDYRKEEKQLQDWVSVFNPYLNRSICFPEKNIQHFLNRSELPSLHMDRTMLERIVTAYHKTKS